MSNVSPGAADVGEEDGGFPSAHDGIVSGGYACEEYFLKDVDG